MAQKAQTIDLKRSYIFVDPDTFLQTMVGTRQEDGEETHMPVMPYAGYNFLPTSYGYRSFFGQESTLGAPLAELQVHRVITYRAKNLTLWAIALCDESIWALDTTLPLEESIWVNILSFPLEFLDVQDYVPEGRKWTTATLEDTVYLYKAGAPCIFTIKETDEFQLFLEKDIPSFLNMEGQEGIFEAGTRLGMWDSMNSVSWADVFNPFDFRPSLETSAGNMVFNDIVGDIVTILRSGENFLLYATGCVLGISATNDPTLLWQSRKILDAGIQEPQCAVSCKDTTEHYAFTPMGIFKSGNYVPMAGKYETSFVLPEAYDILSESRLPIHLTVLHNRYVCFQLQTLDYITEGEAVKPVTPALVALEDVPISPPYALYKGAVVADTVYEKWGKFKQDYVALVPFAPLNSALDGEFDFTDFGITAGLMHLDGSIHLFDNHPLDSYIKYGKIGFYRLGMVHFLEIRVDFRFVFNGAIRIEFSMDGRSIDPSLTIEVPVERLPTVTYMINQRARWCNVVILGNYDLTYMEVRGNISSRR